MTTIRDKDNKAKLARTLSGSSSGNLNQYSSELSVRQLKAVVSLDSPINDKSLKPGLLDVDLDSLPFDPLDERLQVSWSSSAPVIICLNSYPNGITFSVHSNCAQSGGTQSGFPEFAERSLSDATAEAANGENTGDESGAEKRYSANQFHLRFKDTRDYQLPQGKYFLHKDNYRGCLEQHLAKLHKRGLLESAVLYFGTTADPFAAFHKRFDVTTACLQLLEQYRPAKLVVQTRSPMVIAALPTLKLFADRAVAVIPVESPLEKAILRYTPGQPRIAERLVAAQGLRRQGIPVNLCVSPVLPYGDIARDAWDFAQLLDSHADFVTLGCLATGGTIDEKQLRALPVAHKLATDKNFVWLRPHAYRHLFQALTAVAPDKLQVPEWCASRNSQLALFAA